MRMRLAATLALLNTTALSGAALATGDVLTPTAKPDNPIVLAQADGGDGTSGGGAASENDTGDFTDEDAANNGDDTTEAGDDQNLGDGDATETPSADGDPAPRSGEADTEASVRGMDEAGTHRSYLANDECGSATFPAGYSAEDFLDRDIVNAQGEELGEVVDLIVDQNNEVSMVVADIGGFLGLGESRVAIDIDDITVAEGSGGLVVSMEQSELEALPTYEEDDGIWSPRE